MDKKAKFALLLLFSTFLGGVGQLLFKLGFVDPHSFVFYLGIGIFAYLISTVFYLYVLGRSNLSWAYGFQGLSYIFASIFAYSVLGEKIVMLRWAGIIIIAVGTAIIGLS